MKTILLKYTFEAPNNMSIDQIMDILLQRGYAVNVGNLIANAGFKLCDPSFEIEEISKSKDPESP